MDLSVRAFRTVQAALSGPQASDKRKESARKGGLRGGLCRSQLLSSSRKSEIAKRPAMQGGDRSARPIQPPYRTLHEVKQSRIG